MLELRNITKVYPAGGENVQALKGISLRFRRSEFVSILGPSGCGKTTMLNIIGGLDHYTTGDLLINGISTREYKDRDWDGYRNHSVGFVFQSYNLIPHQSVLQNVELALSLSGVSRKERRSRATEALKRVGLGDQLKKRPSEMSGGQMQRVAIARAIVNDPDIILADEPTGALDTETSVQVMQILKEISADRLVIMVTHNPDLAQEYSTRIVKMLDGQVLSDSRPLTEEEIRRETAEAESLVQKQGRRKLPSLSFFTGFGLSLKNLFTKKGRTALTGFAGSIGIIGIALIYAVSQGTSNYISAVQEETLASYPLTIEQQHTDMSSLISTFTDKAESIEEHENDAVYSKAMLYELVNALNSIEEQENDLNAFKTYIEEQKADAESPLHDALSAVQYSYDLNLSIYTKNVDGDIIQSDTTLLMQEMMASYAGVDASSLSAMSSLSESSLASTFTSSSSVSTSVWQELLPGEDGKAVSDVVEKQYDLVYGSWPESYNEVVLFLDENNELNDLTLYALGLKSREQVEEVMRAAMDGKEITYDTEKWSYEEICDRSFRTILSCDCYAPDEDGNYTDLRDTETGLNYLYDNGLELKVVGIAKPSEASSSGMVSGAIGYTKDLTQYVIEKAHESDAVLAQQADADTDIFTGLAFKKENLTEEEKAQEFKAYIEALDAEEKAETYIALMSVPGEEETEAYVTATLATMDRTQMEETLLSAIQQQMGMDEATVQSYLASMSDEEMTELFSESLAEQYAAQYAANVQGQLAALPLEQQAEALTEAVEALDTAQCAGYYDTIVPFSDAAYEDNLITLGCVDADTPSGISLYAATFADKDVIKEAIDAYNESVEDVRQIHYTDYVGLIMSSVTTIINAITYVLIAFVAVSLIVSSIMIGVITLISVQERTKEIGILRALGASKRNVSAMFNAETIIIGLLSGLLGVGITYLLCIPINAILHSLTGIMNLSAVLPLYVAVALVFISLLLTLLAGIIPSRSAARKDPVVALRTE